MSSETGRRLEALLKEEFTVLAEGNFTRLGELLFLKLSILENMLPGELEPAALEKCRQINRELLVALGSPRKAKLYKSG